MTLPNFLIVVAKRPMPGKTKTRLVPPLSSEQATALYECFLKDTVALMQKVPDVKLAIAYFPEEERSYFARLAPMFDLILQEGPDLGARLDNAMQHYLKLMNCNVVIMDSDSPTLPAACLKQAFYELENGTDVVLGPCDDGGYYLIGLKQPAPRLLREVHMSTSKVTQETLALAAEEGLKVSLLPTWYDIDEVNNLNRLIAELDQMPDEVATYTRAHLSILEVKERIHPG